MKSLVKKITGFLVAVAMITALMPSLTFADGVSDGVRFTVSGRDFFVVDGAEKVIDGKTYYGIMSADKEAYYGSYRMFLYYDETTTSGNDVRVEIHHTLNNNSTFTGNYKSINSYIDKFSPFEGYIAPDDTEWKMYSGTPNGGVFANRAITVNHIGAVGMPTSVQINAIQQTDILPVEDYTLGLAHLNLSFWITYFYISATKGNIGMNMENTFLDSANWGSYAGCGTTFYLMTYVCEDFFTENVLDVGSMALGVRDFFTDNFDKHDLRAAGYTEAQTAEMGFKPADKPATGITLDKTEIDLAYGAEKQIIPFVQPLYDVRNENVIWSSSDESVVEVNDGIIFGANLGTAVITATTEDGGHTATCTVNVVEGTVYYVSPDGNDKNDGTADSPFATIQKAVETAGPGETVCVTEGVYRETVTFDKSGTFTAPIKLVAKEGDEVIISGAEKITEWGVDGTADGKTIYKAYVGKKLGKQDMVFFDSSFVDYAKWPNNTGDNNPIRANTHDTTHPGLNDPWLFPTWAFIDSADGKPDGAALSDHYYGTIYDAELPFGEDELVGAEFLTKSGQGWYMYKGQITDSSAGSFFINGNMQFHEEYRPSATDEYMLYGKKIFLDYENEWFCDDEGYIYIITPDGTNPNEADIEVKTRLNAIELGGNDYITIEGINLFAGEIDMRGSNYTDIVGVSMNYMNKGPVIDGDYNRFAESTIRHSLNELITVGGKNNKVINNLMEYGSLDGANSAVNIHNALDVVVAYNTVRFVGNTGVSLANKGGALLTYNDVSYFSIVCRDNGGFYGTVCDGVNTEVSYNWAHDGMSQTTAGFYNDYAGTNFLYHHNVA